MDSNSSIKEIKGIGDQLASYFEKLGINTVKDLLFYVPYKYQDTSTVSTIQNFLEQGKGTFLAEIVSVKTIYTRFRKQITTVKVKDDTKAINLTYFNQPYLQKTLVEGEIYIFSGQVSVKGNKHNIYNPKVEKFKGDLSQQKNLGKLTGIYSETKGLTSSIIRTKIKEVKNEIPKLVQDPLEDRILQANDLISQSQAIEEVHFPNDKEEIIKSRERLAFDEMLRIAFNLENEALEKKNKLANPVNLNTKLTNTFIKSLPYTLTNDQSSAIEKILEEITTTKPMNRLLNGDVGSGKTIVAATAILNTIASGYSAILIAPTTVLASQHFETFTNLFKDFNIPIELCISSTKIKTSKEAKLIIGTHAILYSKDLPKNLNLIVIDEQHRFGVEQRAFFRQGKQIPHYLTMTATPIPRSLTEVFFGDLDVIEIKEKPKNRKDIKTYYTPYDKRDACFDWIIDKVKESDYKEQALIIYPLIEESDKTSVKSVLNEYNALVDKYEDKVEIGFLHGELKPKEKEQILNDFKNKKYNILISTTVIEVGIDIPDITMMVIENAERFGLAQLHQLRGRIGRGDLQSYCYVIPGQKFSDDEEVSERLKYFASHVSGFDVADYDLQKRGPGEVYGTRQSGIPVFKVASIHDLNTLKKARKVAREILLEDNNYDKILENLFR